MAITTINPASTSVLAPKDVWGFIIDDTYTALTITVSTPSGNELAYSTSLGGAQAGYTITVTDLGSTHQFECVRDSGLSDEPTTITVSEDESGSVVDTAFTYYLTNTVEYTEGMQPYTNPYEGTLIITDDGASVRSDVGWIDISGSGYTLTDLGNGKVGLALTGGGAGGGGAKIGEYVYQSGTGSDVSAGQFRFSTVAPTFGQYIYFNVTDNNAEALTDTLALIGQGASIMVRDVTTDEYAIIGAQTGISAVAPTSGSGAGGAWRRFSIDSTAIETSAGFLWTYGTDYSLHILNNFDMQLFQSKVANITGGGSFSDIFGDPDQAGLWNVRYHNWTGTLDPGAADDGYSISSFWWNENNGSLWVCTGNATSAAIWKRVYVSQTNDLGGLWTFNSAAGTPNANGEVEPNNADSDLVTSINIYDSDSTGTDQSAVLAAIASGDQLLFDRAEGAIDVNYLVTGTPVDNTTYWTFPVTETLATGEDYSAGVSYDNGTHIGGTASAADHGTLSGLADDDHAQYARADKTRGGDVSLGLRSHGNSTIGVTSSGKFDTDNASYSLVTSIRINILNDMDGLFDNVATTGSLILRDIAAPSTNWVTYTVASITDVPSYGKTFAVTYKVGAGSHFGASQDYGVEYLADGSAGGFTDAPDGALFTERADHVNTPSAGFGEHWVKNTAPCEPMFTDDAGTDHNLKPVETVIQGGSTNGSNVTDWLGPLVTDYYSAVKGTSWGAHSGAPVLTVANGTRMPAAVGIDGYIESVNMTYQVTNASLAGTFHLYKFVMTDGSTTVTATDLGTIATIVAGGSTTNARIETTAPGVTATVGAGDVVVVLYKGTGSVSANYFWTAAVKVRAI